MTTTDLAPFRCGCGRKFTKAFGLTLHQKKCDDVAAPADPVVPVSKDEAEVNAELAACLDNLEIESGPDFRFVGAIAEFSPTLMDRPSDQKFLNKPVRVIKVNPKTILVEFESGQKVTTESWMLVPTSKPFVKSDAPVPVLGTLVRINGRGGLWVVTAAKIGTLHVALLGGDGNRYLKIRNMSSVIVVDPAEVLK